MRMKPKRSIWLPFIAVMILLLFAVPVKADPNRTNHAPYDDWLQTIYSRQEGLSVGAANDIVSTADGILWIGTYAGLYRYNGTKFQLMNQFSSIKSVECLYVDDKDRLWVGTNDNGITILQNEQILTTFTMTDGLPSNAIRSIVGSSDGNFYVGTSDSMAILTYHEQIEITSIMRDIKYADRSTMDSENRTVIISSYGTMYLLQDGKLLSELLLAGDDRFTSCVFDSSGQLYVGTELGFIYVYSIDGNEFHEQNKLTCQGIRKLNNLIRINDNTIFVCAGNGIGYFDQNQSFHHLETPNFNSNIYKVIADYQGNLWFASSRMGLLRLCETSFVELFTKYSIEHTVVNTVEYAFDKIYIGTDSGLVIIDEVNQQRVKNELTERLKDLRIRHILRDSDGMLWLCTYSEGLLYYDGTNLTRIDPEEKYIGKRVRTIYERKNKELSVSSELGIAVLKDRTPFILYTEEMGLPNNTNLCMLETKEGTFLIGSDGDGIAEVNAANDTISVIGIEQGLPSGVILRMVNDEAGDGIFIVTSNSLCYLKPDRTIVKLEHFPYSNNFDILQYKDTLFVLGSSGIYAVRRDSLLENKKDLNYTHLDNRSGFLNVLVANSWTYNDKAHNKVYLATSTGVTVFDFEKYKERPSDFRMGVHSITVDGNEQLFDPKVGFGFSKNVHRLEIKPEIINYSPVDPIVSCHLVFFDQSPITMSQSELSSVVYTNLPAGKYTFSMELVDTESGVPISNKVYYLERETAFTDTIWFYVLLILGLFFIAALIGLIVARKTYKANMLKKESELVKSWEASITDELTGLRNRVGMRLAFPKQIGQPLTVTMMDVDYFKNFNDTYGHEMGDKILRKVGEVLKQHYQEPDIAFRYGGDEFILIDATDDAKAVEDKIRRIQDEFANIRIEGCREPLLLSHGSASGRPANEEDLRRLRLIADERLYMVKKNR